MGDLQKSIMGELDKPVQSNLSKDPEMQRPLVDDQDDCPDGN